VERRLWSAAWHCAVCCSSGRRLFWCPSWSSTSFDIIAKYAKAYYVKLRLGPESYSEYSTPAASHTCPFSRPVGVKCGVKSPSDPRKSFI
jgi:hypothetical protein